jgi:hypothetical protein
MNALPPAPDERRARRRPAAQPRDLGELRLRRREARRRRGLLRQDIAIGVLGALVLLLATPGVAFAALIALLVLIACVGSVALEHWRKRRR